MMNDRSRGQRSRDVLPWLIVGVILVFSLLLAALAALDRGEAEETTDFTFLDDFPVDNKKYDYLDPDAHGIPVLCYHYFRGRPGLIRWLKVTGNVLFSIPLLNETEEWTLPAGSFENHLRYLADRGCMTLTLDELEEILSEGDEIPEGAVVITIDDGDRSVYEHAFPLLKKYRMKATLFVVSGRIGEKNWHHLNLCTWDEIREMSQSGLVEIESHTHDLHFKVASAGRMTPAFTALLSDVPVWQARKVMTEMERSGSASGADGGSERGGAGGGWRFETGSEALLEDLIASRRAIRRETGEESRYLAWPFGYGNAAVDSIARAAGFRMIFTLRPGPTNPEDLPEGIRRYSVTAWTTQRIFRVMTASAVEVAGISLSDVLGVALAVGPRNRHPR